MPKRRTPDSGYFDNDDNPIGLTGAFAPVKGPQSVDYDTNDDPVGLTGAFGAIPDQDEPRSWDEAGKWKDFDWDAAFDGQSSDGAPGDVPDLEPVPEPELADEGDAVAQPGASVDAADVPDPAAASNAVFQTEGADQFESSASESALAAEAGSAEELEANQVDSALSSDAGIAASDASRSKKSSSGRGRHAAHVRELSPRMKRSKRTRRVLIVLLVLLILVAVAVGFFWYRTWTGSHQEAAQQTQEQTASPNSREDIAGAPADDATETAAKLADVPDLSKLLGMPQDQAIAAIGRGGVVTSNTAVNEEGNPIKTNLSIALADEPADGKTGTPTVYLGLGEDGTVRQAGYSASATALGFGSLSFADAVNNEHVIEKTLAKVGVTVDEGSATLPANKDEYSTYASDKTTVVRERCSFEGDVDVNGTSCTWSSVLSYDYTTQVVTGNLNDTVRVIYVYITMK